MNLRVLSYNIHKGFNASGSRFVLAKLREVLRDTGADLACLQEVVGENRKNADKIDNWPTESQYEYLADSVWEHHAYGQNATYTDRNHGNCILSKYAIDQVENIDLTVNRLEFRGLLHAVVTISGNPLHVFNVHLNLRHKDRVNQLETIIRRIVSHANDEPLVLCGDFNDWRGKLSGILEDSSDLIEVFRHHHDDHAKTFPGRLPVLPLDRIYVRGLDIDNCQVLASPDYKKLSDHLPIIADLSLP